eukprot:TRINITY_DN2650_c0_g2_i3.p1 TRINITY_DN2650_c0_g2~~TRINITY_DN2650_c0_g2_i3.p1  ORF type:complete len:507 (+),score=58.52 TRINITY_DN2650_c0_g2_i3:138-1658(+)
MLGHQFKSATVKYGTIQPSKLKLYHKKVQKNPARKEVIYENSYLFTQFLTNPEISYVASSLVGCAFGASISSFLTSNVERKSNNFLKQQNAQNVANYKQNNVAISSSENVVADEENNTNLIEIGQNLLEKQFEQLPSSKKLWEAAQKGIQVEQAQLKALRTPYLYLQALQKQFRAQLLRMSMQQLRLNVEQLPMECGDQDYEYYKSMIQIIILTCALNVAESILGYIPQSLEQYSESISGLCIQSDQFDEKQSQIQFLFDQIPIKEESSEEFSEFVREEKVQLYVGMVLYLRYGKVLNDINQQRSDQGELLINVVNQGSKVIQDLVVTIAETVANSYILDIRQGNQSRIDAYGQPLGLLPKLSNTRQLERFRNAIALQAWLNYNYFSIEAIFEDRFQTFEFASDGSITRGSVACRRATELNGLKGWRLFVSLLLEAADLFGPVVRGTVGKVGDLVSWLLVQLIGRSLGLIYKGIVQSLWGDNQKKKEAESKESNQSDFEGLNFAFQ